MRRASNPSPARIKSIKPEISVIVPVYQPPIDLFDGCLESLANQHLGQHLEVCIIFDGAPTSDLLECLRRHSKTYKVVLRILEKQQGVSAARNMGISLATGQWLTFLDSDDRLPEGALEQIIRYGDKSQSDIVLGDHVSIIGKGSEPHEYATKDLFPSLELINRLRHEVLAPKWGISNVWGKVYRSTFVQSKMLLFNESLAVAEDTDFLIRSLAATNAVSYFHKTVYEYFRNSGSTVRAFREDYAERVLHSMNVAAEVIRKNYGNEFEDNLAGYVAFHLLLILVHYIANPMAPWTASQRRDNYKTILRVPLFRWSLNNYDSDDFSTSRKVTLFSLKHSIYPLSWLIGAIRQSQLG